MKWPTWCDLLGHRLTFPGIACSTTTTYTDDAQRTRACTVNYTTRVCKRCQMKFAQTTNASALFGSCHLMYLDDFIEILNARLRKWL